jgi:hypothetical protein
MEGLLLNAFLFFFIIELWTIGFTIYVEINYVSWSAFITCFPRILYIRNMADMDSYVNVMATVMSTMLRERITGTWKAFRTIEWKALYRYFILTLIACFWLFFRH